MKTVYENIVEKLYQEYSVHGFISEDRIFEVLEENNISLLDSDSIVDKLLSRGVIIRDDAILEPDEDDDEYDKGHYDYEAIFNSILEIAPELEELIEYVRKIQAPQHREWQVLLPQAQNGNQFARNRIFEMYMRSVLRLALQFSQKYNQPLEDTIQNGFLGLYISIDKFEYGRQDNFPQYYPLWAMQQIRREMEMVNPTIYYPVHVKDQIISVFDTVENHFCELCISNDICPNLIEEVKAKLECDDEDAIFAVKSLRPFDSYDQLAENDADFVDDDFWLDEIVEESEIKDNIHKILSTLGDKELDIIRLRYGFIDDVCYTLEEVGAKYNVTRERVRQIEAKALRKLKHPTRTKYFKGFVEDSTLRKEDNKDKKEE